MESAPLRMLRDTGSNAKEINDRETITVSGGVLEEEPVDVSKSSHSETAE
jgi:hypothetical protein